MSALLVSTFANATDTTPHDMDVETVLKSIRSGGKKLKGQVQQIRNRFEMELALHGDHNKARLAVSDLKKALPAVTWSGTFTRRANGALIQHSGLLCADLDSIGARLAQVREKLKTSPHLFASFISPSGDGLKAVFRVPADSSKHAGSFRAVKREVFRLSGTGVDESAKDMARLCFLSHDPELYINEDATELEPLPEPEPTKVIEEIGERVFAPVE
jgi:VirE-like protein